MHNLAAPSLPGFSYCPCVCWEKMGVRGLMCMRKEGRGSSLSFMFLLLWFGGGNGTGRQEGNGLLEFSIGKGKTSC